MAFPTIAPCEDSQPTKSFLYRVDCENEITVYLNSNKFCEIAALSIERLPFFKS